MRIWVIVSTLKTSDQLAILYRADRLESVPYSGNAAVKSDTIERLEALREAIADMRAVLKRMEDELARMEAGD